MHCFSFIWTVGRFHQFSLIYTISLLKPTHSKKCNQRDPNAPNPREVGCVMCMRKLHDTALYEGRHEVKVLPCFHSVCAACLQGLSANSALGFACWKGGRRGKP